MCTQYTASAHHHSSSSTSRSSMPSCGSCETLCQPTYQTANATSDASTQWPPLHQPAQLLEQLPVAVQEVLQQCGAQFIENGNNEGLAEAASHFIAESGITETFYIYDLGEVARLYNTWCAAMPRVTPHYAVKCNPEPLMLGMLAALGAGFDCASVMELEAAQALGVAPERIIFANPCKKPADFRYAVAHGIQKTTFDNSYELHKIAQHNPNFVCVLRIRCDDPTAHWALGAKYGADMPEVPGLLQLAKELGLQVIGVAFHVGSGCKDAAVYAEAIKCARSVFDMAEQQFSFPPLTLLDVGGGFTAPCDEASSALFRETAGTINAALEQHFPPGCGVDVISEPGRFFAETSAALFATVVGQRVVANPASREITEYVLSDSSLGSFRSLVLLEHLEPSYVVLRSPLLPAITNELPAPDVIFGARQDESHADRASRHYGQLRASRLRGSSGKDGDVIHAGAQLPLLRDGDWLMFPWLGSYTISCATNFSSNAFLRPKRLCVYSWRNDNP